MNYPIYELKINESLSDDSEVSYVALVDAPAIMKDFLAFNEQFIEPSKGEHETEFIPRCIKYVVNEGKDQQQAIAICSSIWEQHFAGEKVSLDYDDTLSTSRGKELAKKLIAEGKVVYIISARQEVQNMLGTAKELGIPESRVYATGSNKAKVEKIKELGITKHYDNNADVVKELGSIGSKFNYFFQVISEDEHIISGPLMIADELIYRNNEKFGEHYVKFSADTIQKIAIKFSKKKYQSNVNLMHDPEQKVQGVTMFESFIVDKNRGILPMKGFEDVADGSWFGSFYVENQEVWDKVKAGEFKGFSVEGLFDYEEPKSPEEQMLQKISELLNAIS
ncbi:Phage-like element PBSX protein, XkdF [uncultured Caudovirales phage]|uniref:Phage-like element PBSX protein, XkdF n=1 Tax=uncultured Caudovirales phage TaxID=2100421 RepID=A0A6J7WUA4_9CAUD|nr:Phage-like element PBSX protein, XkdF [uncultured Caudovirales phage]